MAEPLDVAAVRRAFPALTEGAAHFDGPGGSQVPEQVGRAVVETITSAIANRGDITAAERRADAVVLQARESLAALVGGVPAGVVFGRSMTQLTYDMARALARSWGPGDEVVVTRLDHDANIRPWVTAAATAGARVCWAEFDPQSGELPGEAVTSLIGPATRLVAITAASNLLGTRPDIPSVAAAAHDAGALVYVDGVHFTPHVPVDVTAIGADFFVCSPYKFFGPHLGALVAEPGLLETIEPDKLLPSTNRVPERFELGTLPYELLAGTSAAVEFIADLVPGDGSLRERVLRSMAAVEEHEETLFDRLVAGMREMPGVTLYGQAQRHTPTVLFSVDAVPPDDVYQRLADRGVNAPAGNFYAIEASRWIGLGDTGAVRAGLAPYTNDEDVERLLTAIRDVAVSTGSA